MQDEEAMSYLKEVGPDTMIPCFSVNLKGNQNVEKCNAINMALFKDLCHTSSEQTAHRIPMIVTASSLVPHKHSAAVKNFKKRLGVGETSGMVDYFTCINLCLLLNYTKNSLSTSNSRVKLHFNLMNLAFT